MLLKRLVSWAKLLSFFAVLMMVGLPTAMAATPIDGDILRLRNLDIYQIEILQNDLHTLLEKSEDGWQVLAPVHDQADESSVNDLLRRLSRLTIADELSGDDSRFGLNPPQATIRLIATTGEVRELLIGNLRSPVSLFVQVSGDERVFAISNVTLAKVGEYPLGFVDTTLLRVGDPDAVRSIRVKQSSADAPELHEFLIERQGDAWVYNTGEVAFDVDGFFRAARLVQATGRLPDDDTSGDDLFYPTPGTTQVAMGYADGTEGWIDIGIQSGDRQHYYVRVSDREEIYLVPGFHAEHLMTRAASINDSLLTFDYDFVRELRVKIGAQGSEVVYTRNRDGLWESNRSVVFNFMPLMDQIAAVGADRLVSTDRNNPVYGFQTDPDLVNVRLTFQDNNSLGLTMGSLASDDSGIYLMTTNRPGVYVADVAHREALMEASQDIRTQLFPVRVENVAHIRIQQGDDDFVIDRNGDAWLRDGSEVNGTQVNNLLTALGSLSADSLPPIPEDESALGFYPAATGLRITVSFNDGFERHIDIGAGVQVGTGWFATTNYYTAVSDLDDIAFVREQSVRGINTSVNALK